MKPKPKGTGLAIRSFPGKDGNTYLVFRTPKGAYHIFREVNARHAARESFGVADGPTTVQMWNKIWNGSNA
jgi:hypothetical protein